MATPGIAVKSILDVTNTTLRKFKKVSWVDLSLPLQKYPAFQRFLTDRYAETLSGGHEIQWQVQVANLGNAQHIGAFSVTDLHDRNTMINAYTDWRVSNTHMIIDKLMKLANRGEEQLVDLVLQKKHAAWNDMAALIEDTFWDCPAESDDLTPLGIFAWIVAYATADAATADDNDTDKFLGTFPFGGGTVWGTSPDHVSPTTYPANTNWAAKYTSVSESDLILKIREGMDKTSFTAPVAYNALVKQDSDTMDAEFYMPRSVKRKIEDLAKSQNSQITNGDVAWADGRAKIRDRELTWIPKLDSITGDPVIQCNWDAFKVVKQADMDMDQTGPDIVGMDQHTTIATHWDQGWTTKCEVKRMQAIYTTVSKENMGL